jgi:hypothetical protein
MAHPFDVDALIGRPFGDVLDEIAPGWRTFGLGPDGPSGVPVWSLSEGEPRASAEIRHKLALIIDALRDGAVTMVAIDGEVPRKVWFPARWGVYWHAERGVWMKVRDEAGRETEYDRPTFAPPTAPLAGMPERGDKRPGYRETRPALRAAAKTYAKELAAISTQDGQATFLAGKVGCHRNSAVQFLKDEGK